jgi:hypothetical protein
MAGCAGACAGVLLIQGVACERTLPDADGFGATTGAAGAGAGVATTGAEALPGETTLLLFCAAGVRGVRMMSEPALFC